MAVDVDNREEVEGDHTFDLTLIDKVGGKVIR